MGMNTIAIVLSENENSAMNFACFASLTINEFETPICCRLALSTTLRSFIQKKARTRGADMSRGRDDSFGEPSYSQTTAEILNFPKWTSDRLFPSNVKLLLRLFGLLMCYWIPLKVFNYLLFAREIMSKFPIGDSMMSMKKFTFYCAWQRNYWDSQKLVATGELREAPIYRGWKWLCGSGSRFGFCRYPRSSN